MKVSGYGNIYYFKQNDLDFIEFIINTKGYVYNDFGGKKVEYKKVHHYDCAQLHNLGRGFIRTSVGKHCSANLPDLIKWLEAERGLFNIGYTYCPCIENQDYRTADLKNILSVLGNKGSNSTEIKNDSKQSASMESLMLLSKLIKEKNEIDNKIAAIINRPCTLGHFGEFIASIIFDIKLQPTATSSGIDGYFNSGNLKGKSVDIKFYGKMENLLDISAKILPDYYLVFTGEKSPAISSKGKVRPWLINYIFLFNTGKLIPILQSYGVKIGVDTSLKSFLWNEAEIYPENKNKELSLTPPLLEIIKLFI